MPELDPANLLQTAIHHQQNGRVAEAKLLYQKIIQIEPDNAVVLHWLGILAYESGELAAAFQYILKAVERAPDNPEFFNNLAIVLQDMQEFNAAIASCDAAIQLKPDLAEAWCNRGNALKSLKQWQASADNYSQAISIKPDYWQAYSNRGLVFKELGQLSQAIADYEQALRIQPDSAEVFTHLGSALELLQRFDEALLCHDQAIALNADYVNAYVNRGNVLQSLQQWHAALASCQQALALQPQHAEAHWNAALLLLLLADFAQGWLEYEWRWQQRELVTPLLPSARPRWQPGANSQQRLLVWAEQGVGDHIFFGGLLPETKALVSQLIVSLDPRLLPLFSRSMPDIQFIANNMTLSEEYYDAQLAMGSLPGYLRNTVDSLNGHAAAYLFADSDREQIIRQQLSVPADFLIGISWKSKNSHTGGKRTLDLGCFASLAAIPGIRLVSLQYGNVEAELREFAEQTGIEIMQCTTVDNMQDLDGLAALISACDLVISTDNTTVHLAGALGKATWVLLPCVPDWRWQLQRNDSPWYASVRLFRQQNWGDWQTVMMQVVAAVSRNTDRDRS